MMQDFCREVGDERRGEMRSDSSFLSFLLLVILLLLLLPFLVSSRISLACEDPCDPFSLPGCRCICLLVYEYTSPGQKRKYVWD